jgi:WD40 repeat protein
MKASYSEQDPGPRLRVDWGDALAVPTFYGREEELSLLARWIVQEDCRVVSVLGMGGIGKSALVVNIMHQLASHFEVVIFRSLRDAPSCDALLDDCLQVLSPLLLGQAQQLRQAQQLQQAQGLQMSAGQGQEEGAVGTDQGQVPSLQAPVQGASPVPTPTERRISLLLEHLRETRTLLVLDNLESLLQEGDVRGHLRPDFEGYGLLLRRVVETVHQSCLLFTSREKPADLRLLESRYSSVRTLRLLGLDVAACSRLLEEKEVIGIETEQGKLIKIYGGNPLALKIVSETIINLCGGEISEFLARGMVIFGDITDLLDEQFARLSALEQTVLYWLAIMRESVTLNELLELLLPPLPRVQVLSEAIDGLRRRTLIESGKRVGSFTLQSVVLEYVTGLLVAEASKEIQEHRLDRLIQYGLEIARCKEYVRQTQERLLVCPLLAELQSAYPGRANAPTTLLEEQLLHILDQLRKEEDTVHGYGPANLIALLRLQRRHLNGLDLSQLSIRGAYLQGIEMQGASLAGGLIHDTVWTSAVSTTRTVAISFDGTLWASGGIQGKVSVWDERGQTLYLSLSAHTDVVMSLAFSPDGRALASGSLDGTIKLWDVGAIPCGRPHEAGPRGTLLWMGLQKDPMLLAFSPDSRLLASADLYGAVQLWDTQSGENMQTLAHPGGGFAITWSPDGCLLATGGFDGVIRLWERQKMATGVELLAMQTNWMTSPVTGLAFAPDGTTLTSANWDQTVKLWEVPSGHLLHTRPGQARVVWSPDGRILAGYGQEKEIWLWDVKQGHYRAVLHGHTATVNSIAFAPDSSRLLSGSADSTLRVWDVETAQCIRVIASYAVSLYDLDWSPDGTRLISGGTDGRVSIWDLSGGTPPQVLHGHSGVVWGVGWSPDGRLLASTGWDTIMGLWDPTTCTCVQKFQDPTVVLLGMAWSPDGRLLAHGTYQQGVQVWDMTERCLRLVYSPHLTFGRVAWSPDGTRLVSGSTDGCVHLWEAAPGTGLAQDTVPTRLEGHHGKIMSVVWSPDGMRLASCSGSGGSGELFVWDVERAVRVQTFAGQPSMVSALAWRRNGTCLHKDQLVSGGSDGMLRWWDVESGQCVKIQTAHQGTIQSLRVSPDGQMLASCGDDGAIMIWDMTSYEHLRTLQHDRPYERLNISGIRGLTEAQKIALQELGAITDTNLRSERQS